MVFLSGAHAWPGSGQEKTADESKLKVILQNRRPELFKTAKNTKGGKGWRNYSGLEQVDEP